MPKRKLKAVSDSGQNSSVGQKSYVGMTSRTTFPFSHNEQDLTFVSESSITEQIWNMYRVAPMRFENSEIKLKTYAMLIKQNLIRHTEDRINNVTFRVEINSNAKLLNVHVYVCENNREALKYRAIFVSKDIDQTDPNSELNHVPLLLCFGAVNITEIMHHVFCELFDTFIQPIRLSQMDLMWLSAVCVTSMNQQQNVQFEYAIKFNSLETYKTKNPLILSLPGVTITTLWNNIHNKDNDLITVEEVDTLYKSLNKKLEEVFQIKFDLLTMNRIVMADAIIDHSGRIKLNRYETAVQVLSFMEELAHLSGNF